MTDRIASFPPQRFGDTFLLAPGLERLELLLGPAPAGGTLEALPEPFVRLPDSGGVASTLVGRLPGADDGGRLVGVLLRSEGGGDVGPAADGDLWYGHLADELQRMTRVDPPAAGETSELPPLWFCKRRSLAFVPPCPSCGESLVECLDSAVLAAAGLPPRDLSPHRYLHCPACSGPETGPRFYSLTGGSAETPAVGDRWALVDGFRQQVEASRDAANPYFPCQGCTYGHACYPPGEGVEPGEAGSLLLPITFFGGAARAVDLLPLGYDGASDLLGGREPSELPQLCCVSAGKGVPSREASDRFLFPDERDRRLPLEVLLLKLTVFEQLCAGVEAVHRSLGRPHLNLNPGTARVFFGNDGGAAPTLWRSRVQAIGLEGARPVIASESGPASEFLPPGRFDLAYSHPGVASCPGRGELQPARLTLLAVEDAPDGGCVVEGVLETERIRPGEAGPADTFQLGLGQGLGFRAELSFSCTFGGARDGGILLRSVPMQLDPADRERLAALKALPQAEVRFSSSRRYGVECDLFSLGMLWFRSLLVNRSQGVDAVSQRCRIVAGELERRAGAEGGGAAEELERCTADPLFDPGNLLWEPLPGGGHPVPPELWREAVGVGFRLLTGLSGFSYRAADMTPGLVDGTAVGRLREELRGLLAGVRRTLFSWQPEPVGEIREVLAELIDDPGWLDRVLAPTPESPQPAGAPAGAAEVASRAQPASSQPPEPEPGFDETMILRPGQVAEALSSAGATAPPPPEPDLDETVILKRPPGGGLPVAAPAATPSQPESEGDGEDFEKTVILRRKPPGGGG